MMKRAILFLSVLATASFTNAQEPTEILDVVAVSTQVQDSTASDSISVADSLIVLPGVPVRRVVRQEGDTIYVQTTSRDSVVIDPLTGNKRMYKKAPSKVLVPFYALYNYLSNTDKHEDKKWDGSFLAGPAYNVTTSFAIGGGYTALYSWDRSDKTLQKSILSQFFQVSVKGMAAIGVYGHNFMKHDRQRWNYEMAFSYYPSAFWGIGYKNGRDTDPVNFKQIFFKFEGDYTWRIAKNLYIGPKIDFIYTNTFDNDAPERMTLLNGGQNKTLTTTGLGFDITYDSRDFATNAYRGHYFSVHQLYFIPGLNTYDFWSTDVSYSFYVPTWTKCTLAFQVHGQFNYGGELPWTRMASFGFKGSMRGYFFGQYRDNNVIDMQLEFRQRIKWRLGLAAWVGCGNVFPKLSELNVRHTLPNYGIGVRWEVKPRVNIRLDYGFTNDGGSVVFNMGEAF